MRNWHVCGLGNRWYKRDFIIVTDLDDEIKLLWLLFFWQNKFYIMLKKGQNFTSQFKI